MSAYYCRGGSLDQSRQTCQVSFLSHIISDARDIDGRDDDENVQRVQDKKAGNSTILSYKDRNMGRLPWAAGSRPLSKAPESLH